MKRKRIHLVVAFALVAMAAPHVATAQESTDREKKLMRDIEKLEQRVTDLEKSDERAPVTTSGEPGPNDMRVFWKDTLRFESMDGRFKLRIGGRTQLDHGIFDVDDSLKIPPGPGDIENGVEFRRTRLHFRGTIHEDFELMTQFDFAGGNVGFKDVWLAMNDIPYIGQFKVGHFKEPFGFDQLTSDNYITFMERSLQEVFHPERNTGGMISNTSLNDQLAWAVGVFRDTDAAGNGASDSGDVAVTARVSTAAWYDESVSGVLHIGGSASMRDAGAPLQYDARPEIHLSPVRYVDTTAIAADEVNLYNVEIAFAQGPYSAQAEFTQAEVDLIGGGSETFSGYYVSGSYFLTGENRPYSRSSGTFGRIRPKNDFGLKEGGGWGAWELAARFSTIDLNDSTVRGGEEENISIGVNWYLNANMRAMLNFINADIDHDLYQGEINAIQSRFQVNF